MNPTVPLRVIIAILLWLHVACMKFEHGGYKDIQVAINHNIKEDRRIIENLKELFTNASDLLYNATRGQAYFSEMTIIIPKNWTLKGMKVEPLYGGNHFDSADIRVGNPNAEVNSADQNEPYTLQPGQCGEPGKYIHLTPDFVVNVTSRVRWPTHFESVPVRVLVHEWAHLRYGIFDEYGIPGDYEHPLFYVKGNKVHPATCIDGIFGYIMGNCTIIDGVVQKDCRWLPDMLNPTSKASLMSYHYVPTMEHFCEDNTSDSSLRHNKEAPSKHNKRCDSMSTWSVIKSHEDFKNVKRWPNVAPQNRVNTEPKFVLRKIEKEVSTIVLVLDVSGSMADEDRLKYLKESTIRFLKDRIPREYYVGIVVFDTNAELLTPGLVQIVDESSRMHLTNLIDNLKPKVKTNIEEGMRKGLQMLKDGPTKSAENGVIVLVSDGEETRGRVQNVFKEIEDSKVFVVPIAFGSDASNDLEAMATKTGCKSFSFPTAAGVQISTSKVDEAFEHALEKVAKEGAHIVNVVSTRKSIRQSEIRHSFILDKDVSKKTTITIISEQVRYLSISMIDPSGAKKTYRPHSSSKDYDMDEQAKRIIVRISKATPGKWTIVLTSNTLNPVQVEIQVQCEVADSFNLQPIQFRSWLSSLEVDLNSFVKGKGLRIFAEIKKGYNAAVVNAKVIATIEPPNNQVIYVTLKDDGKGADVSRNDGIYSAYFASFPETGRYSVSVRAINDDGKARIKLGTKGSGAVPLPNFRLLEELSRQRKPSVNFDLSEFRIGERRQDDHTEEEDVFHWKQAEEFERTASAGAFKVSRAWTPEATKGIPPNKVTDLRVLFTHKSGNQLIATLRWTSPGDDMDFGNASWIELRGSAVMTELLETNFITAHQFDSIPELKNPSPSRSLQVLNVTVPANLVNDQIVNLTNDGSGVVEAVIDFHFALRAHDKDNNVAKVSNVATAHFSEMWDVPREAKILTTIPTETTSISPTSTPMESTSTVPSTTTTVPTRDEDVSTTVTTSESTPIDTTTESPFITEEHTKTTSISPTSTPMESTSTVPITTTTVPTRDEDVSTTVTSSEITSFDTTTESPFITEEHTKTTSISPTSTPMESTSTVPPTTTTVPTRNEDASTTVTTSESTPIDTTTESPFITEENTKTTSISPTSTSMESTSTVPPTTTTVPTTDEDAWTTVTTSESTPIDTTTENPFITEEHTKTTSISPTSTLMESTSTVPITTTTVPTRDEDVSTTVTSSEITSFDTTTESPFITEEPTKTTSISPTSTPMESTSTVPPTTTIVPTRDEDVSTTVTTSESTPIDTTTESPFITEELTKTTSISPTSTPMESTSTVPITTTTVPTRDEDVSTTVTSSEITSFDTTTESPFITEEHTKTTSISPTSTPMESTSTVPPTTTTVPTRDEDVSTTVTTSESTPIDTTTENPFITEEHTKTTSISPTSTPIESTSTVPPTTTTVPTRDEDVTTTVTSSESTPFDTTTENPFITEEHTLSTLDGTSLSRIVPEMTTTESTLSPKPSEENRKSWMIFVWICLGIACPLSLAVIVWMSIVQHPPRKHRKRRNTSVRKIGEEQSAANFSDLRLQIIYPHPLSLEEIRRDSEYRSPFRGASVSSLPRVDRLRRCGHSYTRGVDGGFENPALNEDV